MKALILAGGSGTRLRPITHARAKQLLPVANKPVLFYGLESIRDAGVTDVGVVVGDTADEIRAAVGDGSRFGLSVTYLRQERPLGLAHAVSVARNYLGDDDFVMYLGDNFLLGGITGLVDRFRAERPAAQIMLAKVPEPTKFGVAETDASGRVVGLEEKPREPRGDLALVGVYLFTPRVHEAIASLSPSGRGELEITDALQRLIDAGLPVSSALVEGYWKDTGEVEDMLEANRLVLEGVSACNEGTVDAESDLVGRVVVGEGARIVRSRVVGPTVIGPGAVVSDSCVGPFSSIAGGCVITRSEIERSIVLADASITGVSCIEESLIGCAVQIIALAQSVSRAHRFVLADHSRIQVSS
ncbi:glucose-1-phosphate thymidylyltransferase [Nocardiopsis kunsanensis]|uniref:glucose-1-phosphate thymidylyltransferase n=1 Tax=Nocardiopsis kunsanensis TaxID=141693 RepID=UPI00034D68BD|nr:glucose-1-phosphate thymidylyltransferase [Nocardiopsis kunsanensis]